MTYARVFQSGNSQAVRLPKAFRFQSKTVEIFRRGNEVVLREAKRSFAEALDDALGSLPALSDVDVHAFDAAMAVAKEQRAAEDRDWSLLSNAAPPKSKATAKRPARR